MPFAYRRFGRSSTEGARTFAILDAFIFILLAAKISVAFSVSPTVVTPHVWLVYVILGCVCVIAAMTTLAVGICLSLVQRQGATSEKQVALPDMPASVPAPSTTIVSRFGELSRAGTSTRLRKLILVAAIACAVLAMAAGGWLFLSRGTDSQEVITGSGLHVTVPPGYVVEGFSHAPSGSALRGDGSVYSPGYTWVATFVSFGPKEYRPNGERANAVTFKYIGSSEGSRVVVFESVSPAPLVMIDTDLVGASPGQLTIDITNKSAVSLRGLALAHMVWETLHVQGATLP
jgi:hypothetical protein